MKQVSKRKAGISLQQTRNQNNTVADVLNAIECITTAPRDSIKVSVTEGWVRLEGVVHDWTEKETVDNVARHVPGVKGVFSLLQAQP